MQIHHEADPKQQCDRDANVVTKSFDAESYDFDSVTGPLAPKARIFQPILLLFFCFLALEFVYKSVSQIFLFRLKI